MLHMHLQSALVDPYNIVVRLVQMQPQIGRGHQLHTLWKLGQMFTNANSRTIGRCHQ